jgi:hypothetical protein
LRHLVERIRHGDPSAASAWQETFQPQMVRIVRRAIRAGDLPAGFVRHVVAAADHLDSPRTCLVSGEREELIAMLAARLGSTVFRRLQAGVRTRNTPPPETVHDRARESVVEDRSGLGKPHETLSSAPND